MPEVTFKGIWFGTFVGLCFVIMVQVFGADTLANQFQYYSYEVRHWDWFGAPNLIHSLFNA